MGQANHPPRLAERFFSWFCHKAHLEGLEGDLYEIFERNVQEKGLRAARLLYLRDIATLLRTSVAKPLKLNSKFSNMDMYKNYLHTVVRMGVKHKGFSLINLLGLTLGITSVLFILIYVNNELKYDKHVAGYAEKYRSYLVAHSSSGLARNIAVVPPIFAPEFKKNFPQITKAGRLFMHYGGGMFRVSDQIFAEKNGFFAEQEALDILDLQLEHGSIAAMADANSMLVSASTFRRFFGDAQFSEQTVIIGENTSIKIGGIYADFPRQSHLKADYLLSFELLKTYVPEERMNSWNWQQFYTYFEVQPGTDMRQLLASAQSFIETNAWPVTKANSNSHYEPRFQNLADIHLHSDNMQWDVSDAGSYQSIVFLLLAAVIILLIACLNFINLTSAQALKRAKEVTVRKFIGANRSQLITQYITESMAYVLVAALLSTAFIVLLLPYFNQMAGKEILMSEIFTPRHIGLFVIFVMVLGVISGIYPAVMLSAFKPLDVMRGTPSLGTSRKGLKIELRQLMVGLQYVLSIGLILVSLIIQQQYSYLRNTDMGFNKENLLVVPLSRAMKANLEQTRQQFSNYSNIKSISACYGIPGGMVAGDNIIVPGNEEPTQSANIFVVDEYYIPTMDMELAAGRNFSTDIQSDEAQAFVINETAVKNLGFGTPEEAIGKPLHWEMWNDADTLKKGRVVGVVKDFNYKSLHASVESVVMHIDRPNSSFLLIKIGDGHLGNTLAFLEAQYKTIEANSLFEFEFVDQSFQKFYESEQRLNRMFSVLTVLAIFTASIGLFGLVSYSVASRGKEIGIRKVLGADTNSIFMLLVYRYFALATISLVIALPLAYYFISGWLENFAYRIVIGPGVFLLVVAATVVMTILTVGYQAFRGASMNPSEKLRAE